MKLNSVDEKLDYLKSIGDISACDEETWAVLADLSADSCGEVRMTVARILSDISDGRSERLLLRLTDDKDYLVRCEACISLANSSGICAFDRLLRIRGDENYLVRGYALMSAAAIAVENGLQSDHTLEACLSELLNDPEEWVVIAALYSSVLLGKPDALARLLCFLDSHFYQNRTFVLTLLDDLLDAQKIQNPHQVIDALTARLRKEENNQIADKIQALVKKCAQTV